MKINVVLFEPEIPANTGNIMRTCVATNSRLHLIEPLGFKLDEKSLRRAGLDYLRDFHYQVYANWQDFIKNNQGVFVYITRYGKKTPHDFDFKGLKEDLYLVFGRETSGLPYELLHANLANCIRLPMVPEARSLNLANCVAIMVYHALGELDYLDLCRNESIKGEDWIFEDR